MVDIENPDNRLMILLEVDGIRLDGDMSKHYFTREKAYSDTTSREEQAETIRRYVHLLGERAATLVLKGKPEDYEEFAVDG